ncbi:hypothetical protein OPQ81_004885 [Rhizoctonia solani]|nr:hypothetical protein OPQ81_004885 [Rhizoctonia solani]
MVPTISSTNSRRVQQLSLLPLSSARRSDPLRRRTPSIHGKGSPMLHVRGTSVSLPHILLSITTQTFTHLPGLLAHHSARYCIPSKHHSITNSGPGTGVRAAISATPPAAVHIPYPLHIPTTRLPERPGGFSSVKHPLLPYSSPWSIE